MSTSSSAPRAQGTGREALEQVQRSARELLEQGKPEEAWDYFLAAIEAVLVKNRELELLVAKLRRERLGTKSERTDPGQLALLFDAMVEQAPEPVDADAEHREDAEVTRQIEEAEDASVETSASRRKADWKTEGVARERHRVRVPRRARECRRCGRKKRRIGEDVTRRIEYVPAHFVEHEHRLEKLACSRCKDGVTTAPAPPQVLPRCAADASLLAHVVVSKHVDHVPLHRLSRTYARSGAEIPVSTLAGWVAGVGDLVEPLVECLAERVRGADVARSDATGLKVLDSSTPENIHRGTMWGYVGDDRDVVFRYTPTGEGATGPWSFLEGRTGPLQVDAANVFDRLFNGQAGTATEVGCLAHARRRLVKLQDTDCRVAYPLLLIRRVYRLEHLADARRLDTDGRRELRQERTRPVMEKLQRWLLTTGAGEPPGSALAVAVNYFLNNWTALTRFLDDGRLSPDNNLTERQLRDIALGRKNYLFAGSHRAAERLACLYSLTRTCALHGVLPLPYFTDVLRKLAAGWPADRLGELLPGSWHPDARP